MCGVCILQTANCNRRHRRCRWCCFCCFKCSISCLVFTFAMNFFNFKFYGTHTRLLTSSMADTMHTCTQMWATNTMLHKRGKQNEQASNREAERQNKRKTAKETEKRKSKFSLVVCSSIRSWFRSNWKKEQRHKKKFLNVEPSQLHARLYRAYSNDSSGRH